MHSDVIAALNTDRPEVFFCIELAPAGESPIRFLEGGGFVPFSEMTFVGDHPDWGSCEIPEAIDDGLADEADTIDIKLLPPSDEAALAAMALLDETTGIRVWGPGAINRETGASLGAPDLCFVGYVEQALDVIEHGGRHIAIEGVGGLARFLDQGERPTMNNAAHQAIYPGELGFVHVTGLDKPVYWGSAAPVTGSGAIGATPPSGLAGRLLSAIRQAGR